MKFCYKDTSLIHDVHPKFSGVTQQKIPQAKFGQNSTFQQNLIQTQQHVPNMIC